MLGLEDETGQGIETIANGVAWMDKRNTTPPAERFQMVAQGWDSRGAQIVEGEVTIWFSPDGKNWTTIGKKVDSSDTQVIPVLSLFSAFDALSAYMQACPSLS